MKNLCKTTFLSICIGVFLWSSCSKEELPDQNATTENTSEFVTIESEKEPVFINAQDPVGKDYITTCAGCTPKSGWQCVDYDFNNRVRGGANRPWWNGQTGFRKAITPVAYQYNARCNRQWYGCRCDYDIRVYFDGGRDFWYFNDPRYSDKIFVRYNVAGNPGQGFSCTQGGRKVPRIDYLSTNGPGPHPPGVSGDYIRVTIGEHCKTPIALVAR